MYKNLSPTKTRRGNCLVLPHTGYALGRQTHMTTNLKIPFFKFHPHFCRPSWLPPGAVRPCRLSLATLLPSQRLARQGAGGCQRSAAAIYAVEIWDRQGPRSGATVHSDYATTTMMMKDDLCQKWRVKLIFQGTYRLSGTGIVEFLKIIDVGCKC